MAPSDGPVSPSLLVELDRRGEAPLHEQIEHSIRENVRAGRLAAGSRLPSSRSLAAELGISRGVVSEAYGQLAAEGYLLASQGAPVRVAHTVRAAAPRPPSPSLLPEFAYRLDPCLPDLAGFPRDRWLRSLRAAWQQAPIDAVDYPDPRGVPALRETLAEYLGRVRGAAADPEQVMICTGFSQGLSLIARWLRSRGVTSVALEDPGWHSHRLIVEQAGLAVEPIPVDAEGLRVDLLERSEAAAVIVTSAHQFPTGVVLSSERRAALIDWAETGERLIVEDDFDAELRYDRTRVGSLQGLAPERVAYIGSASKRLVPGMRLGWMLTPSWLGWPLISVKAVEDRGSEAIGQLALHDFIARGELDRHLRRMRLHYQRRREALLHALARHLPMARAGDGAAGLYELVELPEQIDEATLVSAAAARGVGLEGLALHRFRPIGPPGLVLGFGAMPEPAIERSIELLAEAWLTAQSG
ncbi:MAG: GntR family transcriptional regulator / MocR family aminotransferase [Solirubrobacterales bacterium]|jgi:GntR family transcriptional regulator/MocR family aminotransferase|nr:GntR family transcriptional regulator / MocR family aminotransferase [Solirubrobacterales bacterium]